MGIDLLITGIAGLGGFVVFTTIGVLATLRHHKQVKSGQMATWTVFITVAVLVFIAAAILGYLYYPEISNDVPIEQFIRRIIFSSVVMGGSPGLGVIAGALGAKLSQSDDKGVM